VWRGNRDGLRQSPRDEALAFVEVFIRSEARKFARFGFGEADELFQESVLVFLLRFPKFLLRFPHYTDDTPRLIAYGYLCAFGAAHDMRRKRRRERFIYPLFDIDTPAPSAEPAIESAEEVARIRAAIAAVLAQFPSVQSREAITAVYGLDGGERVRIVDLASRRGCSSRTIERALHRFRKRLGRELTAHTEGTRSGELAGCKG
jgi:RNA polymerase sigma factor (sigma-70 family)